MQVDELVDVVEAQEVVHEEQLVHVEEEQFVQLHLWLVWWRRKYGEGWSFVERVVAVFRRHC